MSRAASLVLLCCVAGAFGCSVPSLDSLEQEGGADFHYACSAEHPCPKDNVCSEGRCLRPEELKCTPGATVACGDVPEVGQCHKGTTVCTAEGKLGATCEGVSEPVAETCDGLDNDCDGEVDIVNPFGRVQDSLTSVAGTVVNGVPLLLTIKSGMTLQLRTVNDRGDIVNSGNSLDMLRNTRASLPTLVTGMGTGGGGGGVIVLVAWIEKSVNPKPELVFGRLTQERGVWQMPTLLSRSDLGMEPGFVTDLALAFNTNALLALMTTSNMPPNADVTNATRHTVAVLRPLPGGTSITPTAYSLGVATGNFGLAVAGQGSDFLAAYEEDEVQKTVRLPPVASPRVLDDGFHRSPYILPDPAPSTGYNVYYARNYVSSNGNEIVSVHCSGGTTGSCDEPQTLFSDERFIARMSLATPLMGPPSLAVFSWGADSDAPEDRGLAAARLSPTGAPIPASEMASGTSSEILMGMENTRWVAYTKVLSRDDENSASEMFFKQLCLPPPPPPP